MNRNSSKSLTEFFEYYEKYEKININLEDFNDMLNETYFFEVIKYLFVNKKTIHDILYREDIIISLNSKEENDASKDLPYLLPLSLLLLDSNFTDFSFSLNFLLSINELRKKEKEKYKKVIISKISLDLINYYKGLDEYFNDSNKRKKEIEKIRIDNDEIVNNNTTSFNQFGLNIRDIKSKNIKEIYIEILKALISQNKDKNYNVSFEIISQLHLNSLLSNINDKEIKQILEEVLNNLKEEKNYNNSINLNGNNINNSSWPTLKSDKKIETIQYKQKYEIFDILKKEKNGKKTVEFIKQIGKFYIFGFNNSLIIYDESNKYKKQIKDKWVYNIINIKQSNEEKIEITICTRNSIETYRYEKGVIRYSKVMFENLNSLFLIKRDNSNEYYICTTDNVLLGLDEENRKTYNIFDEEIILTKSGIKLNDNLIIFKSNKVASKGKDKLKIYNYKNKTKSEIPENEKYSFIFSANGLEIMDIGINNKNKILLCACKKYIKNQRNGILVVNFEYNKCINHFFYETNNFEVYCFC